MRISVITICYNSGKTIENTILSVITQDYSEVEYIIIDGGSMDNTLDIVNKYRDKIAIVISEPDKGISDAFNKGISHASGEIIGIINSDDKLADGALKKVADNIKSETDIFHGDMVIVPEKGNNFILKAKPVTQLYQKMALNHPATYIRKSAYGKYGKFDLHYKCQMDRELMLRMYTRGAKFQYYPCILAWYSMGGVSDTQYLETGLKESYKIIRIYGVNPLKAHLYILEYKLRYIRSKIASSNRVLSKARDVIHLLHSNREEAVRKG